MERQPKRMVHATPPGCVPGRRAVPVRALSVTRSGYDKLNAAAGSQGMIGVFRTRARSRSCPVRPARRGRRHAARRRRWRWFPSMRRSEHQRSAGRPGTRPAVVGPPRRSPASTQTARAWSRGVQAACLASARHAYLERSQGVRWLDSIRTPVGHLANQRGAAAEASRRSETTWVANNGERRVCSV